MLATMNLESVVGVALAEAGPGLETEIRAALAEASAGLAAAAAELAAAQAEAALVAPTPPIRPAAPPA